MRTTSTLDAPCSLIPRDLSIGLPQVQGDDVERSIVLLTEEPRHESYGTVVVFLDLYGNKWDLLGPPEAA